MAVSIVTTTQGPSTTHLAVAGTVPSSVPELEIEMVGGRKAIEKKVEPMAEKLVEDIKLKGSYYEHRGRCKLCGWQSFGYEEEEVKELVKRHALQHWRDLAAGESGQSTPQQQLQGLAGQPEQQQQKQKAPSL